MFDQEGFDHFVLQSYFADQFSIRAPFNTRQHYKFTTRFVWVAVSIHTTQRPDLQNSATYPDSGLELLGHLCHPGSFASS